MQLLNQWKKTPYIIQCVLLFILAFCLLGVIVHIKENYTISAVLGILAYILLITSMTQEDIIKLRLYGACAGCCFMVQFALSDLPLINSIGQGGLIGYGLFKAYKEIKAKKEKA